MKPYFLLTGSIVLALLGIGYSFIVADQDILAKEDGSVDVVCKFFYRPAVEQANGEERKDGDKGFEFKEKKIELTIPVGSGPQPEIARVIEPETVKFDSFHILVTHQVNSLVINVLDEKDKAIMTQLYQFNPKLKNQFDGGHGFSGLVYVYHPENRSELQFFCGVK